MNPKPFGLDFLETMVSDDVFGATSYCCTWHSYDTNGIENDGGDDGCHTE